MPRAAISVATSTLVLPDLKSSSAVTRAVWLLLPWMAAAGMPLLGDGKYGSERFNKNFGEKGQALYSYKLEFSFPTDAGILEYLRGKVFPVESVDFAEKYFNVTCLDGI